MTFVFYNYKSQIYHYDDLEYPYDKLNLIGIKNPKTNNMKVAIIDTGIDLHQPCFKNFNIESYQTSHEAKDENNHGTLVIGTICNSRFIENIKNKITFYSIDIGNDNNVVSLDSLISGIKKAIELKADIINISLGIYNDVSEIENLIDKAVRNKIIIVCSAGNNATNQYVYPAAYSGVISVSSIDQNNIYMLNNNFNDKITICLPGEKVNTGIYDKKSKSIILGNGTSSSAAMFTSIAIVLKNENPNLDYHTLVEIIKNTAVDLGKKGNDEYYGYGLMNFKDAIMYIKNPILYILSKAIGIRY